MNIISWLWGTKYTAQDVLRLKYSVQKNLRTPHRFVLFTDQPMHELAMHSIDVRELEDRQLTARHCYCRLRMFDPNWQKRNNFKGTIVSLDLDLVIIKPIDDLLATQSTFKILQGVNAVNPNPYNASIVLIKAGMHADVWNKFSIANAKAVPYHEFPDDQGWLWHMLPEADGWKAGEESGIYGFQKPGWPRGSFDLPDDARVVAFIGKRKPHMYSKLPWVQKYWVKMA